MVTNKLQALAKYQKMVAKLEKQLAASHGKLRALPGKFGYKSMNDFIKALHAAGKGGSAPSGNYLSQLQPNPGDDYILVTTEDFNKLDLALGNGQVLGNIYDAGLKSRPSVTDNGSQIVFVNAEGHIIGVDMVYTATDIIPTVNPPLSSEPIWRNAAISKDGRFIAALSFWLGSFG